MTAILAIVAVALIATAPCYRPHRQYVTFTKRGPK